MLNTTRKGDKTPKGKRVATLHINDAASMTPSKRAALAKWLRAQADHLLSKGREYGPKFKGEYLV